MRVRGSLRSEELLHSLYARFDMSPYFYVALSESYAGGWRVPVRRDWDALWDIAIGGNGLAKESMMQYSRAIVLKCRERYWIVSTGKELRRRMDLGRGKEAPLVADFLLAPVTAQSDDADEVKEAAHRAMMASKFFLHSIVLAHEDGRLAIHRASRCAEKTFRTLDPMNRGNLKAQGECGSFMLYPDLERFMMSQVPYGICYTRDLEDVLYYYLLQLIENT